MVITKEQAATATSYEFYVTFSQEEHSPEDPANPCANYPTEEYSSYAGCDDHFVRRSLPPELKPFWTVDNISEASSTFYFETPYDKQRFLYDKILSGVKVSDCLLPCLRTTATVERGMVTSLTGNTSALAIGFSQTVKVKRTSLDRFSFTSSLNLLGSNLGLWPGLGLFQLLEWAAGIVAVMKAVKRLLTPSSDQKKEDNTPNTSHSRVNVS